MYKSVQRTKKRKKIVPSCSAQSLNPQSWRGAHLAVLGRGAGRGTAAAPTAPLLPRTGEGVPAHGREDGMG